MGEQRHQEECDSEMRDRDILIRDGISRIEKEMCQSLSLNQARIFASNLERVSGSLRKFGNERDSPIMSILGHVGNYWRSGILCLLLPMPLRPSAIIKQLAALVPDHTISHRILTLNLRALERDGLIRRYPVADSRARVEYELTEMGRQVCELMWTVISWGEDNYGQIVEARERFDQAN